ncbi:MAG: 3-phosphoglycerate dehydrogenase [Erysipelotrichaceae bacterium]|nr:3-phosphoglycerate dehydrogenase [Erysipelotrichaceae bacterium]
MNIRTYNKIAPEGLKLLREGYEVSDKTEDPNGIILRSHELTESELPESLQVVSRAGIGVNNIPVAKCTERGIAVFNTPGANSNAVKELVICGLLLASRKVLEASQWLEWVAEENDLQTRIENSKKNYTGHEIKGKTVGVIGMGNIGIEVANALNGLGMKVIGYNRTLKPELRETLNDNIQLTSDLNEVYTNSDYITLHIPLTESTRNFINADAINKMKENVLILNFARGELVNENDIRDALSNSRIACYVTDFPTKNLIGLRNFIGLPHLGASTYEAEENCAIMAANNLRNYLEEGITINTVNLPAFAKKMDREYRICLISKTELLSQINELNLKDVDITSLEKNGIFYTVIDTDNEDEINTINDIKGVIRIRTLVK